MVPIEARCGQMRTNEPIFFTMASSPLVKAMDITEDFTELHKRILLLFIGA